LPITVKQYYYYYYYYYYLKYFVQSIKTYISKTNHNSVVYDVAIVFKIHSNLMVITISNFWTFKLINFHFAVPR
jgi:hypothetical protein